MSTVITRIETFFFRSNKEVLDDLIHKLTRMKGNVLRSLQL